MNVRDLIEALAGVTECAQVYIGPNLDPVDAIDEILFENEPYVVLKPAERNVYLSTS